MPPLQAQTARLGQGEHVLATLPASVPFSAGSGVVPLTFVILDAVYTIQDSDRETEKGPLASRLGPSLMFEKTRKPTAFQSMLRAVAWEGPV